MAAIDKIYIKDYYTFDRFRLWCIAHKPTLLYHFYKWNMTEKEWDELKEHYYENSKKNSDHAYDRCSCFESLRKYYDSFLLECPDSSKVSDEQVKREVSYYLRDRVQLQDKETWTENYPIPITNFSCEEDKYLLWHCPIKEIREYLHEQCGYKEKWYYKLFFKY